MKNDIKKLEKITDEMFINDISYKIMQKEYDLLIRAIDEGKYDNIEPMMRAAYFYKRVLSVLENKDIPMRASIGLIDTYKVLDGLFEDKDEYIGDSDADTDIYEYVIEYGYRMYDRISHFADTPQGVFIKLITILLFGYEDEEDEDNDE